MASLDVVNECVARVLVRGVRTAVVGGEELSTLVVGIDDIAVLASDRTVLLLSSVEVVTTDDTAVDKAKAADGSELVESGGMLLGPDEIASPAAARLAATASPHHCQGKKKERSDEKIKKYE